MNTKNEKVPPKKKKKQKGRGYLTIKQIETALLGTGGFVTYAAKKLNCTHQNIKKRIDGSPYLQEVMDSIHEGYLDLSEHALLKRIRDEDLGAICFYLKCQGKKRGYVEKQQLEHTGKDDGAIEIHNKISDDPKEASRQYQRIIKGIKDSDEQK
ncbi:MAG: hypothetical protein PF495_01725 [Spirochaetales bacterium]|jgi:hypothetical protein|nr:hypothetical protein [Spirochaetales bacterium]